MLYRRAPKNPPTVLLRIVAAAGAGTLIGVAACGGDTAPLPGLMSNPQPVPPPTSDADTTQPGNPALATPPQDDSGGPCNGGVCGSAPNPGVACGGFCGSLPTFPEYDDAGGPCNGGPCGVVAIPQDASVDATVADASDHDAKGPCNGGPCGVVVMPEDASDDDATGPCNGGPCGVAPAPPRDASADASHHDASLLHCPPVCGVVINPGSN